MLLSKSDFPSDRLPLKPLQFLDVLLDLWCPGPNGERQRLLPALGTLCSCAGGLQAEAGRSPTYRGFDRFCTRKGTGNLYAGGCEERESTCCKSSHPLMGVSFFLFRGPLSFREGVMRFSKGGGVLPGWPPTALHEEAMLGKGSCCAQKCIKKALGGQA